MLVRPGVARRAHIDLRQARQRVEGELFIPGGPALLGGHESSLFGRELLEVDVPSFFLSALPVSFADFLEFLEELFQTDPTLADQLLPAASDGAPYWQWNGTDFIPAQVAVWGESPVELLCLPAVGVDLRGALAYLQWRSQKTGLDHRLPTEAEWEKAARGTDGRAYPWGDHFDPSFCKMRLSRRGPPAPEPSGTFAHDESPYGVRDLAGGVADWVLPGDGDPSSAEYAAARGGAWCDWSADCHAAARRLYWGTERSDRVGFRLARSPAG